jgi:hypothetical protein
MKKGRRARRALVESCIIDWIYRRSDAFLELKRDTDREGI